MSEPTRKDGVVLAVLGGAGVLFAAIGAIDNGAPPAEWAPFAAFGVSFLLASAAHFAVYGTSDGDGTKSLRGWVGLGPGVVLLGASGALFALYGSTPQIIANAVVGAVAVVGGAYFFVAS